VDELERAKQSTNESNDGPRSHNLDQELHVCRRGLRCGRPVDVLLENERAHHSSKCPHPGSEKPPRCNVGPAWLRIHFRSLPLVRIATIKLSRRLWRSAGARCQGLSAPTSPNLTFFKWSPLITRFFSAGT
jgi:hypothetical protein